MILSDPGSPWELYWNQARENVHGPHLFGWFYSPPEAAQTSQRFDFQVRHDEISID
jgi:hypothetical protein